MRYIRWIGAALVVGAAAVASMLTSAEAAPGDVVVMYTAEQVTLTGQQRATWGDWIEYAMPRAKPQHLDTMTCARAKRVVYCSVTERLTITAAQYVAAEASGQKLTTSADGIAEDGSEVTVTREGGRKQLTHAMIVNLQAMIASTFGVDPWAAQSVSLWRDGGEVMASATYTAVVTPTERLQCLRGGQCGELVGVVE